MSQAITKSDLNTFHKALSEELKENTRDIIAHFNKSQGVQNNHLDAIDERLDVIGEDVATLKEDVHEIKDDASKIKLAVIDLVGTDRHMHNLVHELKGQNINLDEAKIFST